VFAAASLADALGALSEALRGSGLGNTRFSFASSSTLARQIEFGAPAHIYASASSAWMNYLLERKLIDPTYRRNVLSNELVLISAGSSRLASHGPVRRIRSARDIVGLLANQGRMAIGDPAHVPAGIYAKQALTSIGVWHALSPRLARTDNVRGALALVERGEAAAGIVYASDARLARSASVVGVFAPSAHEPIVYPFGVVEGAPENARQVWRYLTSAAAKTVYARFGFTPLP
jgi:molybdate transport system substrate-binding protein